MNTADTSRLCKLLLVGVASATLAIGASTAASASTGTTEPADDTTAHTEAEHTMDTTVGSLAVDGSAEASSPEAEAFCMAAVNAIAAFNSEDEAQIGPAAEALIAAAPEEVAPAVGDLMANPEAEPGDPAFDEPYAAMFDYLRGNCGYAEADVAATEYTYRGLPTELPAGPTIISLENIGAQVHELLLFRVNDDVTLTLDELLALPEEESDTMATPVGFLFAFPGTSFDTVVDLTPGRYIALCGLPEGATPEVMAQMEEPEGSPPEGGSAPAGSEPAGTAAEGSAPEGSAPGGPALGPPHFTLGMAQEITVT
jgi:hypothetical protein